MHWYVCVYVQDLFRWDCVYVKKNLKVIPNNAQIIVCVYIYMVGM